jgi:hypothetical protein
MPKVNDKNIIIIIRHLVAKPTKVVWVSISAWCVWRFPEVVGNSNF